jgi:hypothetical protein
MIHRLERQSGRKGGQEGIHADQSSRTGRWVSKEFRRDRQPGRQGRQKGIHAAQKARTGKQDGKAVKTAPRTGRRRGEDRKCTKNNGFLFLPKFSS